jgi:hypothetical protein
MPFARIRPYYTLRVNHVVNYKVVRLTELMAYEFGQVEGDIDKLDERELAATIPQGMSFSSFMDKLRNGELALLTDRPSQPVMQRDNASQSWGLSSESEPILSPAAKHAFLSRARMSRGGGGAAMPVQRRAAEPSIDDTYVPEPVIPDTSDRSPTQTQIRI